MSTGGSTFQLAAEPGMRGRVMSLWLVGFQDSTPLGGPIVGWTISALEPAPASVSAPLHASSPPSQATWR
jgi:hypothetical protein